MPIVYLGSLACGVVWGCLLGHRLPMAAWSWRVVAAAAASVVLIAVEVYAVAGVSPAALLVGGTAFGITGLIMWRYALWKRAAFPGGGGE